MDSLRPLAIDLDGTLIHTDTLHELALQLLHDKPHFFLMMLFWMLDGKAFLKQKLATHVVLNIANLPFNNDLIEWLKLQKKTGRRLILCTASDLSIARSISEYLNLFDEVMASDGKRNLAGKNKTAALVDKFGEGGFDYVGNSSVDLEVWEKSKQGIVVNSSNNLIEKAKLLTQVERVIPRKKNNIKTWSKVFRFHQWIKNFLIFVPIFAAHQTITEEIGINLFLAFLSFGLCASSVYITNDLLDLQNDRHYPHNFYPFLLE